MLYVGYCTNIGKEGGLARRFAWIGKYCRWIAVLKKFKTKKKNAKVKKLFLKIFVEIHYFISQKVLSKVPIKCREKICVICFPTECKIWIRIFGSASYRSAALSTVE